MNKNINILGIIVGIAGVAYALYTTRKMDKLCNKIDKTIDDVAKDIHVDVSETVVEKAIEKAVDREVGRAVEEQSARAVKSVQNDIHSQIKTAVNDSYTDIRKSVVDQVTKEVANIDIKALKRDVTEKAKESIVAKFDGNLDNLLEEFNSNLTNVSKIYKSIAETMTGNKEKETVLRIS